MTKRIVLNMKRIDIFSGVTITQFNKMTKTAFPRCKTNDVLMNIGLTVLAAVAFSSCQPEDQSTQFELTQLKAERSSLKEKVKELEGSVSQLNKELDALRAEASDGESFDKEKSMSEFITRVSKLKESAMQEYPGAKISESVQLPSFDKPLVGQVKLEVKSPGGEDVSLSWTGRGTLSGDWTFGQPVKEKLGQLQTAQTQNGQTQNGQQRGDNGVPPGSRKIRETANGVVWITPEGQYIIRLK